MESMNVNDFHISFDLVHNCEAGSNIFGLTEINRIYYRLTISRLTGFIISGLN
jgi:hypothetical protein